jgi:hypothetical protein
LAWDFRRRTGGCSGLRYENDGRKDVCLMSVPLSCSFDLCGDLMSVPLSCSFDSRGEHKTRPVEMLVATRATTTTTTLTRVPRSGRGTRHTTGGSKSTREPRRTPRPARYRNYHHTSSAHYPWVLERVYTCDLRLLGCSNSLKNATKNAFFSHSNSISGARTDGRGGTGLNAMSLCLRRGSR